MGGVYGYVKGKTKIACYLNFRREVNRKEIEESTGSNMDAGTGTKKELYRQMNNYEKNLKGGRLVPGCSPPLSHTYTEVEIHDR